MSAAYVKFQQFVQDLGRKVHNLETDLVKIYLSNATPNVATHAIKTDIAEISTGSGYSGPIDISATYSQTSGTATLAGTDQVVTAAGGSIGPFRYVILYNDTPTSPVDPLIAYWDYGSSITLADGETFTVDFAAAIATLV